MRQFKNSWASSGMRCALGDPHVAVDHRHTVGRQRVDGLVRARVAAQLLQTGQRVPEAARLRGARTKKPLHLGRVAGHFDDVGLDLIEHEVDRRLHVVRIFVVLAERPRQTDQVAAVGDVADFGNGDLALQSWVRKVLPLLEPIGSVDDDREGGGLESDRLDVPLEALVDGFPVLHQV